MARWCRDVVTAFWIFLKTVPLPTKIIKEEAVFVEKLHRPKKKTKNKETTPRLEAFCVQICTIVNLSKLCPTWQPCDAGLPGCLIGPSLCQIILQTKWHKRYFISVRWVVVTFQLRMWCQSDPPENCHVDVKQLQKKLDFFLIDKIYHFSKIWQFLATF